MPHGIAVLLGDAPAHLYHPGSQRYRLFPSLGEHETVKSIVTVAFAHRGADHGGLETSAFFTDATGDPQPYSGLVHAEALSRELRVVGRHDIAAALGNLRYIIVPPERQFELREIGQPLAQSWAKSKGLLEPEDYAVNNWGTFAAKYLVDVEGVLEPTPEHNRVDWRLLDAQRAAERQSRCQCNEPMFS